MLPELSELTITVLEYAATSDEIELKKLIESISGKFEVTFEDRESARYRNRSPSIAGRIQTARTYLTRAGLIETTKRGYLRITPRGRKVLKANASRIDRAFLTRLLDDSA